MTFPVRHKTAGWYGTLTVEREIGNPGWSSRRLSFCLYAAVTLDPDSPGEDPDFASLDDLDFTPPHTPKSARRSLMRIAENWFCDPQHVVVVLLGTFFFGFGLAWLLKP